MEKVFDDSELDITKEQEIIKLLETGNNKYFKFKIYFKQK